MNVTLSIDDELVERARRIAAGRGTSLNQMIRDLLEVATGMYDAEAHLDQLETLWATSAGSLPRGVLHPRGHVRRAAPVSAFLDTNVLLYADDLDAGNKRIVAQDLVRWSFRNRDGVVSTQVLQEYFVDARKKLAMEGGAARARVEVYGRLNVVVIDVPLVLEAIDLHRLDGVSLWDALVVRSAVRAGCQVLYKTVRVVNPFATG